MVGSVFSVAMDALEDELRLAQRAAQNWISPDALVTASIQEILNSYRDASQRTLRASQIDFRRPELRCAYLFLYVASHSRIVETCLARGAALCPTEMSDWQGNVQSRSTLRMCCVGGGPGTDIVGLLLFLQGQRWTVGIRATVLDKWPEWQTVCVSLLKRIDSSDTYNMESGANYVHFDFFWELSSEVEQELRSADIVTLVKFLSAVSSDKAYSEEKLQQLLSFIQPGALVFFMDNSGGGYREMMCRAAKAAKLHLLMEIPYQKFRIPNQEECNMGTSYFRFSYYPQKNAQVAASLWRKS